VQTVTPLAEELGLRIERTVRLIPSAGKDAVSVLRMGSRYQSRVVVLCTHGEVIHDLQEFLSKGENELLFGKNRPRDKGSVWMLNRRAGRITSAQYFPLFTRYAG
jgi:hypothetical protein